MRSSPRAIPCCSVSHVRTPCPAVRPSRCASSLAAWSTSSSISSVVRMRRPRLARPSRSSAARVTVVRRSCSSSLDAKAPSARMSVENTSCQIRRNPLAEPDTVLVRGAPRPAKAGRSPSAMSLADPDPRRRRLATRGQTPRHAARAVAAGPGAAASCRQVQTCGLRHVGALTRRPLRSWQGTRRRVA